MKKEETRTPHSNGMILEVDEVPSKKKPMDSFGYTTHSCNVCCMYNCSVVSL